MKTVHVSASKNYNILIAPELLLAVGEKVREVFPKVKTAAIITDDNVKALYLEPVMQSLSAAAFKTVNFSFPAGESSKNTGQYISILNWLCENKLTRSDIIVALGGGVVGDMAGFAAATYLRGLPFIQIPTTLLAMVDSSVGGKTGIDLDAGKNLAGAFYQPSLVLCGTKTLETLPEQVFKDGMAEVIKYGMLGSKEILDVLGNGEWGVGNRESALRDQNKTSMNSDITNQVISPPLPTPHSLLPSLIEKCVSIKRDIVQRDEFDTGERMLLNLGHTIGHAIEKLSSFEISHGFAVAIGMAIDTRAAYRKGLCPNDCLDVLNNLLAIFGLPNKTDFPAQELYKAALHDKKRDGDLITNVVPCALGKSELKKIPAADLLDWLETGSAL